MGRMRRGVLLGPCFAPKIHDEVITNPTLSCLVDPVLSTTEVNNLAPSLGAELLIAHLTMVRNVNVLFLPGRLVVLIVPRPDPEVSQPLINVLSLETALDLEPAMDQEVLRFFIGQLCVRFGRRYGPLDFSKSLGRSILGEW